MFDGERVVLLMDRDELPPALATRTMRCVIRGWVKYDKEDDLIISTGCILRCRFCIQHTFHEDN